jgi:hypothetical protein
MTSRNPARYLCGVIGAALVLIGCIPAQELPPQLAFTPGAPLTINATYIQFAGVRVEYPLEWRVITSAAETPESLLLIAPQGDALLMLSRYPAQTPPSLSDIPQDEQITLLDVIETPVNDAAVSQELYLWLVADTSQQTHYESIFQQVRASIR